MVWMLLLRLDDGHVSWSEEFDSSTVYSSYFTCVVGGQQKHISVRISKALCGGKKHLW